MLCGTRMWRTLGQFKGRRNFKRVAEFRGKHGAHILHCFSVSSHGKGFHDALGHLIARMMKKAEGLKTARIETSHDLYMHAKENIEREVYKVRNIRYVFIIVSSFPYLPASNLCSQYKWINQSINQMTGCYGFTDW